MKKISVLFAVAFILILSNAYSMPVSSKEAKNVAMKFMGQFPQNGCSIADFFELKNETSVLAYVFNLIPQGYVVVAANTDLPPVPAYSFESVFGALSSHNTLSLMLKRDLAAQSRDGSWSFSTSAVPAPSRRPCVPVSTVIAWS